MTATSVSRSATAGVSFVTISKEPFQLNQERSVSGRQWSLAQSDGKEILKCTGSITSSNTEFSTPEGKKLYRVRSSLKHKCSFTIRDGNNVSVANVRRQWLAHELELDVEFLRPSKEGHPTLQVRAKDPRQKDVTISCHGSVVAQIRRTKRAAAIAARKQVYDIQVNAGVDVCVVAMVAVISAQILQDRLAAPAGVPDSV